MTSQSYKRTALWSHLTSLIVGMTLLLPALAMEQDGIKSIQCPDVDTSAATISIAASTPVKRLATAWAEAYVTEKCVSTGTVPKFLVEETGSSSAASRVCGTRSSALPVDIAGMSRTWTPNEAQTDAALFPHDWMYQCERSSRSAMEVEVAMEGIALAYSSGGAAAECLESHLNGGLTPDQIRWIFSSWNEDQLVQWSEDETQLVIQQQSAAEISSSWSLAAIPHSDGNPATRLWSELHSECPNVEIDIVGPSLDTTEGNLFRALFFPGIGETFNQRYGSLSPIEGGLPLSVQEQQETYLKSAGAGITFFGIATILTDLNEEEIHLVSHIQKEDAGSSNTNMVRPSAISFQDGTFPLSRRLYMNLYNEPSSLSRTRAFIDFGLTSEVGLQRIKDIGLWPISGWETAVMTTRMQSESGIPVSDMQKYCGVRGRPETISFAGSTTVLPIARVWSDIYRIGCPHVDITLEVGGSSVGAARVCGGTDSLSGVDVGDMSRDWRVEKEATLINEGVYRCNIGDPNRGVIQIDVAVDGVTFAVQGGGVAWRCINDVLGGLTPDQVRWIYSSYTDEQLEATGWDPTSLLNSDGTSSTHKWSELHSECEDVEIKISGPSDGSGTNEQVLQKILRDNKNDETFDANRPFGYFNSLEYGVLLEYLQSNGDAISYVAHTFFSTNNDVLKAVAIRNSMGEFVKPTEESISDGSYNPLSRRIFMNLHNDWDSLGKTAPLMRFGLEHPRLVTSTGQVPIPTEYARKMINRIDDAPYDLFSAPDETRTGLILGCIAGGIVALVIILYFGVCSSSKKGGKEEPSLQDTDEAKEESDDSGEPRF